MVDTLAHLPAALAALSCVCVIAHAHASRQHSAPTAAYSARPREMVLVEELARFVEGLGAHPHLTGASVAISNARDHLVTWHMALRPGAATEEVVQ